MDPTQDITQDITPDSALDIAPDTTQDATLLLPALDTPLSALPATIDAPDASSGDISGDSSEPKTPQDIMMGLGEELQGMVRVFPIVYGQKPDQVHTWEKMLLSFMDHIKGKIFRVAVIGSVKAGKSTFINSLLGADYLKRGAGIITSAITRVLAGPEPSARIVFKSLEEINKEIIASIALCPEIQSTGFETGPLDIDDQSFRQNLAAALKKYKKSDDFTSSSGLDPNVLLLSSFLSGFERVRPYIINSHTPLDLTGQELAFHQEFVGREDQAVFIKDVFLTLPFFGWATTWRWPIARGVTPLIRPT
ncbi:MAG: dynamin family protein [Deltaproteobacteria bacterium]|nr:dynamin family protein [Deltaproteobacteria bacterium]